MRAAWDLVKMIDSLVATQSEHGTDVRVIVYFDNAHSLSKPGFTGDADDHSLYNALCTALSMMHFPRVFSIMLSTNSGLYLPRPSPVHSTPPACPQVPWTESTFDYMDSGKPIIGAKQYSLVEIAKVEFMVKFGRPL